MNKKGFTLVELLVVIVLLVVLLGTTIFGIDEITQRAEEKRFEELKTEILLAAEHYMNTNNFLRMQLLNKEISESCVRIYQLQNMGLLDSELTNPITNENISGNLCVISKLNENGVIEHTVDLE